MGFIEETGVAQHYRDVRITPIYEGTNGVQAADLVGRKLGMENGGVVKALLAEIAADSSEDPNLAALARDCLDVARLDADQCQRSTTSWPPASLSSACARSRSPDGN